MAYTAPSVRSTGDVITSGNWNTDIKDNILWLATDKPMCRLTKSAGQTISWNSETSLTWNQETFDNASLHDTSTNTERITIPTGAGGTYLVGVHGYYQFGSTNVGDSYVSLRVDGTTSVARGGGASVNTTGSQTTSPAVSTLVTLTAGQYIEARTWHISTSTTTESFVQSNGTAFWAIWMGT